VADDPKNAEFWAALGGYVDPSTLPAGEPDTEVVQKKVSKLLKMTGSLEVVSEGPLAKSMLASDSVYLVHATEKLSIWVGKTAPLDTKKNAMNMAVDYIAKVW
jgi:Gelsolin repeat